MKSLVAVILMFIMLDSHASCVILLHGLSRTEYSMSKLESTLEGGGFHVVNLGYPSRQYPIKTLAEKAIEPALAKCPPATGINFVTHSLGGILVRQYLKEHHIPGLQRVVMLGPPNQGSEVVDKLGNFPGFHFINGDASLELGTDQLSVPNQLGPADFDLGIIAGDSSIDWISSLLIPGPDDGKVSVERTKLPGMDDHLIMNVTHFLMMRNKEVIKQVLHYLQHGFFKRV